jgi:hypothetical protein
VKKYSGSKRRTRTAYQQQPAPSVEGFSAALARLLEGGGAASVASVSAAALTEIYLCNVCSCRERLRCNGRG